MPSIPGLDSIDWTGIMQGGLASFVYWGEVILIVGLVFGILGFVLYLNSFPIKCTYFECYGSGRDGILSVGKECKNRFKWIDKRGAWKALKPFGNKRKVKPFDSEYIYLNNKVYAYRLNGEYCPIRINLIPENKRGEMCPVSYESIKWYNSLLKENEQEFAEPNWWKENRGLVMVLGCALFCCIMVCVAMWVSSKMGASYFQQAKETVDTFSSGLQNYAGTIGGGGKPLG